MTYEEAIKKLSGIKDLSLSKLLRDDNQDGIIFQMQDIILEQARQMRIMQKKIDKLTEICNQRDIMLEIEKEL